MNRLLWDGDFYRTIPCESDDPADWKPRPSVSEGHTVREQIGYLPWYFHLAGRDKDDAFLQLTDPNGFAASFGLTTAEQRHPRLLFQNEHFGIRFENGVLSADPIIP